jgi:hypothetical protein
VVGRINIKINANSLTMQSQYYAKINPWYDSLSHKQQKYLWFIILQTTKVPNTYFVHFYI